MTKLGIGILTWQKPTTLKHTLRSYVDGGLLRTADDAVVLVQQGGREEVEIAQTYGLRCLPTETNIGIGRAFELMARSLSTDFYIPLENDWELVERRSRVQSHLDAAVSLIASGVCNCVRLRHRTQPGDPLYSEWLKGQELTGNEDARHHLLDCVHWREHPNRDFPELITRDGDFYAADSEYANHTNNPVLYSRAWFLDTLCPRFIGGGRANEAEVYKWWAEQNFVVAQGSGLFRHRDLNREPVLPARPTVVSAIATLCRRIRRRSAA